MTGPAETSVQGAEGAAQSLSRKLKELLGKLDAYETENYKLLMALAAGKLASMKGRESRDGNVALATVLGTIRSIKRSDVIWRGRPSFMNDAMLDSLRREARLTKRNARRNDAYWMDFAGPVAKSLAELPEFSGLLGPEGMSMEPAGCMYVFYLQPGDRVDPHVDEYEHSLNAIVMIEHDYTHPPSHLLLFHPDKPVERVALAPGEMVIIDGGGLVHAREPVKEGESISILTVGWKPHVSRASAV